MDLWSEVENQVQFPRCSCGKCECGIGEKFIKMIEEEKAHKFLMSVNDEVYFSILSQILALEPLPPLDKIFNMVSQEEAHRNIMITRDDRQGTIAAFAVKHTTRAQPITERPACKHCGMMGRKEAKCFEVIGTLLDGALRENDVARAEDVKNGHRMEDFAARQPMSLHLQIN